MDGSGKNMTFSFSYVTSKKLPVFKIIYRLYYVYIYNDKTPNILIKDKIFDFIYENLSRGSELITSSISLSVLKNVFSYFFI